VRNLRIGQLARTAGVHLETVRFYEAQGLIPEPPRSSVGYRLYSPEAADRIRFIKRAQELGFSLHQIRELLDLRTNPGCLSGGRPQARIGDNPRD
jgi:MerR family mercuric resistance operon transcriptional regulator